MSDHDELRLHRIRKRIRELTEVDRDCTVFGANGHEWKLEDPLHVAVIEAFERRYGIELPDELHWYLEHVSGGGAGPYYGLLGLPGDERARELALAGWFVGDLGDESVASEPSRRGGYLPLADQGCGYASVLVLGGPRRGAVLADMREAHEGFLPEAPSFLAWLEQWLERALAEWAERALPDIVTRSEALPLAELVAPLLERRAAPGWRDATGLYPTAEVDRLDALLLLRIHQRRFDDAEALIDRLFAVDERDPVARRELARARIAGAREDREAQLAAADCGLEQSGWYYTETELLRQRESALLGLERRAEAIETMLRRAEHTRHLHAYYDAAWSFIADGDHAAAVGVLVRAAEAGVGCERNGPLAQRVEECGEGLLATLRGEGQDEDGTRMMELIRELE
jgi:tetratricopeptide (TPR) repeat protein